MEIRPRKTQTYWEVFPFHFYYHSSAPFLIVFEGKKKKLANKKKFYVIRFLVEAHNTNSFENWNFPAQSIEFFRLF